VKEGQVYIYLRYTAIPVTSLALIVAQPFFSLALLMVLLLSEEEQEGY
jgi:hypothetical protein